MSLKKNAITGLKWLTVSKMGQQLLQFTTLAILARLLLPEDFGLMTSAMVVIGFINIFRDLGLSAALIQKQHLSDELFSSVFWLSAAIGFTLMILLIVCSPYIADFYNAASLIPILQVLSLSFLFSGISAVQQALLEKQLQFKSISKFELSATFLAAITGITLAILEFGVWSLVMQNLVFTFTIACLFWIRLPKKPKLIFKWKEIRSILNFSTNLAGFNILNYFVRNADYILIQKFLGAQQLGYYSLAYRLMLYPLKNITVVITRVMFPVLAKIQDDNKRFQDIYLRLVNTISLLTFPLMLGLIAVRENFVMAVFGTKWEPVSTLILIFAPLGLIQSIYTPAGIIFQAKGRTDWWFKWGVFTGVLFITAFWVGLNWGIIGVASAYLITNIITFYPGVAIPFKLIELKVSRFILSFKKNLILSLLMLIIVFCFSYLINIYLEVKESLIVSIFVGVILYTGLSYKFNRSSINYILESIKN